MLNKNLLRSTAITVSVVCLLLSTACGSSLPKKNTDQTSSQISDTTNVQSAPDSTKSEDTSSEVHGSDIAKINGAADEVGIYSIVVRLTDKAADKGIIEMVYHGAKGSPQENSVVNTFRIEYYKNSDGKFEISTFFDGETYQNQHGKDEVKVTNTFGANLRAGSVAISYTPDGGDAQEIFSADADYFYVPTK